MVEVPELDEAVIDARVEDLLAQMTLEEKVSLLSGKNSWQTMPIERLGIPSLTMTDGPHGVRANRTPPERIQGAATSFPTGVSMAASWDTELVGRVGAALARETRALGCDILLGPCVNIARTPLAGRNFESYSEDPYLAGKIGAAWVKGLQGQGIGASLKHFACNNQETERSRGSSVVDERTLREMYLAQFETIVKEAQPWTVMCSYNRINGVYASQNGYLQNRILRDEWGFKGVVVSDWGANHTTVESVSGGLDIEMPGPARYYGDLLVAAVRTWQIEESVIDQAARRVLRMIVLSGKLDEQTTQPTVAANTEEHAALARQLAASSITLLKNAGDVLPLADVSSIAVIGPNAAEARIGGGGSSYLEPPYRVSPLQALEARLGGSVAIHYTLGCDNAEIPPALKPNLEGPQSGQLGFWGTYYDGASFEGEIVAERAEPYLDEWRLNPPAGVNEDAFSARWVGAFSVLEDGRYQFRIQASGQCQLLLDGTSIAHTDPDRPGEPAIVHADLTAGRRYIVTVEWAKPEDVSSREIRMLCAFDPLPDDDDRLERAIALAASCDVALVFAGMPKGFESEGHDRPHMSLPGQQDELIHAVARANSRTVVVLNCGSPVEMPWAANVDGIVLAYYPGQEGGNAIVDVLTGEANPSGKLPISLPIRYQDNPTYINFPGTREVRYGEGIFVGYRYYEAKGVEPLFPFGHGLSYTSFVYDDLVVPTQVGAGESFDVSVTISNTGDRPGEEVVQLYVRDRVSTLARPVKELKGFRKVRLSSGEQTRVTFTLDDRALAFYDPLAARWVVEPGEFDVLVGSSSSDIRLTGSLIV
jgi:beta-glucosidase